MKKKILLFLLFLFFLSFSLSSKNLDNLVNLNDINFKLYSKLIATDSIKKQKKKSKVVRNSAILAVLPYPLSTAGSSCGDGITPIQVNVYAFGANGNETIEWFAS
ncbi:RNase P/RNase MRP subunit p30 [Flavobacterium sp. CG_9.1]|uniref:hypothetical protein n=1 Tax=Flavobacterium sp. CG_9.1 TaxID=2787728 RepID=UPI0018CA1BF9|nr:hypothetical protein [Flavobacterium sp. CG_9.1]MBG6063662.1 RNase P/RNase MRP subunit p30 [Flavobacterium sp. CG_9.1]